MSKLLLGALAVLWAAILAPPLLRARAANQRPVDYSDFYSSLSQLAGRRGPRGLLPSDPAARRRAILLRRRTMQRRRRVLGILSGAVGVTFLAASFGNGVGPWALFAGAVVLLLAYVGLLALTHRSSVSIHVGPADLRYLRTPILAPELALRRTASS